MLADQDDYWLENKIENGISFIREENDPALYFCNTEYVDSQLKSLGGNTYNRKVPCDFYSTILNPGFIGCTMVFNSYLAKILQRNEIPKVISMHDSFIARVCVSVGGKIFYDQRVHVKYRQHGNNVIGSTVGYKDAIKRRINTVMSVPTISISSQLEEIVRLYGDCIDEEKYEWIYRVIRYKENRLERLKLALSKQPNKPTK